MITSQSISSLFPGGGSWPSGYKISISGTLTVDQTTTFDNLEFILGSGAKIVVTGTGTVLTAKNNTLFHGCASMTMWRSIGVQSGARIAFDGTKIEDAWIGITFSTSANIAGSSIDQTVLEDNVTGIYYAGLGSSTIFKLASFSGNKIKRGIGDLLPPPTGSGYSGSQPWRGIFIALAKADFASNASTRNEISGHRYGIFVNNSTLTIANFSFNNALDDAAILDDTLDGTDICAFGSTISVGGSDGLNCRFFNSHNSGIISRSTKGLTVTGASFTSPAKYGIRCPQSVNINSPVIISGNDFDLSSNPVAGIFVERPPSNLSSLNTSVRGNTMTLDGSHQKNSVIMIDVQGKMDATGFADVNNNIIEVLNRWRKIHGIRITGKGNNYQVYENDLSWTSAGSFYTVAGLESRGIIANDLMGSGNFITDNDVVSLLNTSTGQSFLKSGIHLVNNPFTLSVCENRIDNSHFNIRCSGGLGNTQLKKNEIKSAAFGLFCKSGTDMPDQDRFENRWNGATYVTRGAEYEGGAPPFKFLYDPSSTISDDRPSTVFPSGFTWFDEQTGSNPACGSGGGNIITEGEREFIDSIALSAANAGNWDTRRLLLYKLMRYPELISTDPDAAGYLDDNESANTSAWRFAYAEHLFDQAYVLSTSLNTAFTNITTRFRALSDTLVLLDIQQAQDTTTYDTTIAQQRYNVFAALAAAADSLEQLRTQAGLNIQPELDTALIYAQNLPDTSVYEENLKAILVTAIRYAQGDSLTESDFSVLRSIAAQCPATGGTSIQRAPLWLDHEEAAAYIAKEWDDNCIAPLVSDIKTPSGVNRKVQVFPNPASNYIQMLFPDNTSGNWQITDLAGTVIREGRFDANTAYVSTTGVVGGLYLLNCRFASGEVTTEKISIYH
ncbi:MAG: T9SS C-terminal target domain-containing protein [Haliscomenobacteraceae bacterium CHB4]|nr:hypothetical protein [Saprospiraceae bacterium]MCE7921565.1 T9SS C-terminal target domain-containing protein [Haliscomenobacteraceae bacterium CHB4]